MSMDINSEELDPFLNNSLFENIDRITAEKYEPTVRDVLRARVRTNGVIETEFIACQGALRTRVLDAGISLTSATPQWTIAKWMRCFEDVKGVIFVVSLSGYDMLKQAEPHIVSIEIRNDSSRVIRFPVWRGIRMKLTLLTSFVFFGPQNRLQDSIELFRKISSNRYFQSCLMILFLNKMDLFRQKILYSKRHLR